MNFFRWIFSDLWSSMLFFSIVYCIIWMILEAIGRKRRDTLIKQDYERMESRREHQ